MEPITIVTLGPAKRPSVLQWLRAEPGNVYIGPKNEALRGSGFRHDERESVERAGMAKYIHFDSKADIDMHIASFEWQENVRYNLGFHISLVTPYMLELFKQRLCSFFSKLGETVVLEAAVHTLHTLYLGRFDGSIAYQVEAFAIEKMKSARQHVFLGSGTVWQQLADLVTANFQPLFGRFLERLRVPFEVAELYMYFEAFVCRDEENRLAWQARYVQELADAHINCDIFQDGACLFVDVPRPLAHWTWKGISLRPDLLPQSVSKEKVIEMNDLFGGSGKVVNIYESYPALMRVEAILRYSRLQVELRGTGSIGCCDDTKFLANMPITAHDLEETLDTGVAVNLSCFHHGLVPAVTLADKLGLFDPNRRAYVLAKYPPLHPCCVALMQSQLILHKPPINQKILRINATEPQAFDDKRKIAEMADEPLNTLLWPCDKLLWDSIHGMDCGSEFYHVSRYVVNEMNQCQWTRKDYAFVNQNPGGVMDHMLRYHVGSTKRTIGVDDCFKCGERPAGTLVPALKRTKEVL